MNKQEMLNKAREIKEEYNNRKRILKQLFKKLKKCGNLTTKEVLNENNEFTLKKDNTLLEIIEQYMCEELEELEECKKQLQEIKDDWKDGCGKEFINPNINVNDKCGDVLDNDLILCNRCEKQNKEFKEICSEVGI